MLIKKEEAKKVTNSDNCTVWEYNGKTDKFNTATAYINGRFPDEKRVVNLELEETYYVLSGSATIYSEKGTFEIKAGDVYIFAKGEKFYLEANELRLVVFCVPAFDPKQHIIVE